MVDNFKYREIRKLFRFSWINGSLVICVQRADSSRRPVLTAERRPSCGLAGVTGKLVEKMLKKLVESMKKQWD
ncbi:MAG: hypothetical protein ABW007_21170 [Chitinophagaceae bacterium]